MFPFIIFFYPNPILFYTSLDCHIGVVASKFVPVWQFDVRQHILSSVTRNANCFTMSFISWFLIKPSLIKNSNFKLFTWQNSRTLFGAKTGSRKFKLRFHLFLNSKCVVPDDEPLFQRNFKEILIRGRMLTIFTKKFKTANWLDCKKLGQTLNPHWENWFHSTKIRTNSRTLFKSIWQLSIVYKYNSEVFNGRF